jgi:hypothetical protein
MGFATIVGHDGKSCLFHGIPQASGLSSLRGADPAIAADRSQEETISVETVSGRTFTGYLDAKTDVDDLWLRTERDSVVLLRPIAWDRVTKVHLLGRDVSGGQLHKIVEMLKPRSPAADVFATVPREIVIEGSLQPHGSTASPDDTSIERPQVRSLAIEASLANWDGDVEMDGLLVRVLPLDSSGAMVATRGTLRLDLTGQRKTEARGLRSPATLQQWTQLIAAEDFGLRGAVYRLPFRGTDPEFDLTVAPYGMLHARLSVPAQGTFETTEDMLRIRPYSSVRDRLQLSTGRRFLPQERTSNGS